jgi:hypothetical protein
VQEAGVGGRDENTFRLMLSLILSWGLSGCTKHLEAQHEKTSQKYEDLSSGWNRTESVLSLRSKIQRSIKIDTGIFKMPERPLCQITFADNYKMENGPHIFYLPSRSW